MKYANYSLDILSTDMLYTDKTDAVQYNVSGDVTTTTISNSEFYESSDIVSIDTLTASATATQSNYKHPLKCNFSFDLNFHLKLNLPDLSAPPPNFDLLYSINTFAKEVGKINDDLITAIKQMNCCDLEDSYNHTIVPFFRWLADHKDSKYCSYTDSSDQSCGPIFGGNTFPQILYNIAKVLVQIYIVVRPFICLIRPIPGNPWYPFDFDQNFVIRFIVAFFDMYYDLVISGKIINPLINVTKKIRQTMDYCLFGKQSEMAINLNMTVLELENLKKRKKLFEKKINTYKKLRDKLLKEKGNLLNEPMYFKIIKQSDKKIFNDLLPSSGLKTPNNIFNTNLEKNYKYKFNDIYNINDCVKSSKTLNKDPNTTKLDFNDNCQQNIFNEFILNYIYDSYLKITGEYIITITNSTSGTGTVINSKIDVNITSEDEDPNIIRDNSTGFNNFITDLKKIKERIEDINSKIANYNDSINFYNKMIKELDKKIPPENSPEFKEHHKSITSKSYLIDDMINKMANNNTICDCIISVIEVLANETFKMPALRKIKDFSPAGFSEVKGLKTVFQKLKDLNGTDYEGMKANLADICYGPANPPRTENEIDNLNFIYSDYFIKLFNSEMDELRSKITINSNIIKIQGNGNDITIDLTNNDSIDKFLKQKYTKHEFFNANSVAGAWFVLIDNETDLHQAFILKKIDSIDVYTGDNLSYTYNESFYEMDNNILPTDAYRSSTGIFVEAIKKYIEVKSSELNKYRIIYNEQMETDKDNWQKFTEVLNQALNIVKIKLQTTENNFSVISTFKYKKILNDLKYIQSVVGLKYPDFTYEKKLFLITHNFDLEKIDKIDEFINDEYTEDINSLNSLNSLNSGDSMKSKLNEVYNAWKNFGPERIKILNTHSQIMKYFLLDNLLNDMQQWVSEITVMYNWVYVPIEIPCTCDGLICKLIQTIINLILTYVTQLIQSIFNGIMELFWKSPIGKLIKFIIAKIKCYLELVNVKKDLKTLEKLKDNLVDALKNNIKLYTDPSVCLNNIINDNNQNTNLNFDDQTGIPTIPDIFTPGNLNNDINNIPSITGESMNDNNYTTPTINITQDENGTQITNNGTGDLPAPMVPTYPQILNNLPVVLNLTEQVGVGSLITYPHHKFPLLTFICDCTPTCLICNEETKKATFNFFSQYN